MRFPELLGDHEFLVLRVRSKCVPVAILMHLGVGMDMAMAMAVVVVVMMIVVVRHDRSGVVSANLEEDCSSQAVYSSVNKTAGWRGEASIKGVVRFDERYCMR